MVKHNYSKIIQNWQVAIPHCYWEWSCLFGHMWHQLLSWTCWYVSLIVGKAQGWGLDLRVENDTQRKLGDLSVDCLFLETMIRWGQTEVFGGFDGTCAFILLHLPYMSLACVQVRIQGSWNLVSRQMDSLEQKQPFISTLAQFHIHALSHGPRHDSNNQVHSCHSQKLSITEFLKSNPLV